MSYMQDNPYQASYGSYAPMADMAAEWERAAFIRRTYVHLGGAILAFAMIETLIFSLVPMETLVRLSFGLAGPFGWLLFLGGFMVVSWVARSWASSATSVSTQYIGLALYVIAQAVLFVPLLTVAFVQVADPRLIPSAGIITLIVFSGITLAAFVTKKDFSFLRMYLVWGGFIALGLIVCAAFFQGLSLGIWFSLAMVALASGYILYDTSNVIHHYRTDQHVAASLALFASVALLFWYVIRLLMQFNRR
jgi:hypothetical protein